MSYASASARKKLGLKMAIRKIAAYPQRCEAAKDINIQEVR